VNGRTGAEYKIGLGVLAVYSSKQQHGQIQSGRLPLSGIEHRQAQEGVI
jgi:hypothetical protein